MSRWTGVVDAAQVDAFFQGHLQATPGVLSFCLASSVDPRLSAEVRKRVYRVMSVTEDTAVATAFVFEDRGFVAASLRAFVSGLSLLSREPTAVSAYRAEGARFLSARGGRDVEPEVNAFLGRIEIDASRASL